MPADQSKPLFRPWLLVIGAFLTSALLAIGLIWRSELNDRAEARARAGDLAADHAQALQRGIERALSATYAIAALVRQGQGSLPNFESVATQMLPFYPGIAALGLSPNGVIQHVVPLAGNEKSIGFNQLQDLAQNKEAIRARDTGQLTLAGPLKLAQGGLGVVGRLPIFLDDAKGERAFWGFTYVTLRFPQALQAAQLGELSRRGFAYELWRVDPTTGERQQIDASGSTALVSPAQRSVTLPNGSWTLSIEPTKGWTDRSRLLIKAAVALLICLMMAYLTHLLIALKEHEGRLEAEVRSRTLEIDQARQHLMATIAAVPDLLFELGLDGRYYSAHSAKPELLVHPPDDLFGKTVAEVLPEDAAAVVMDALREAHQNGSSSGKQYQLTLPTGLHWFEMSVARKQVPAGQASRFVMLSREITAHKAAHARIELLAHFDPLTGLPNRTLLSDRCSRALHTAHRQHESLSLMFIDLDHFKNINDSLGHGTGDALLVALASRLTATVREQDTVSRLGGDEFILVLPDTDARGAAQVAKKLLAAAMQPFVIDQHELTVTPSIGIALYPDDGSDFETLSRCADAAMYRAKQAGRNTYRLFTAQMQAETERTLLIENALRRALERGQLSLEYQPQLSLHPPRVIGAEALLRWHHPELGSVSPAEFIPVAESSGLILPIGQWVLDTALQQLKSWMEAGLQPVTMAVNLSSVQFRQSNLPELISRTLDELDLPAHLLEVELTEGSAMDDPLAAIAVMSDLHERGIKLSIDDFGTGYSSLSYLKKFRATRLKIDQSFVRDITIDAEDRAIVSAIISMADSLGMSTIAEGVETTGQLDFLRERGCAAVQGYLFSRPLRPELFAAFVDQQTTQSFESIT
ncbi:MAG: EAL domain-containing protein [Rhodoferax sp.]|nr:EAL domain-containing protein [Rhodoferax sp.]